MIIDVAKLIGKEAELKLRSGILHKIAAEQLRERGFDVGPELDLWGAVAALGTEAFMKNAETKSIFEGLVSLHELSQEQD